MVLFLVHINNAMQATVIDVAHGIVCISVCVLVISPAKRLKVSFGERGESVGEGTRIGPPTKEPCTRCGT